MNDEITAAEIVPVAPSAIVAPADSLSNIVAAFNAYQAMQQRLLTDADYQTIQGKRFPTKSAWRKLAVAFNVTTEIDAEHIEYDEVGDIKRATYRVRATAPNGRSEQGVGVCSRYDKCRPACKTQNCDGLRHFSHPEHDIVATAHTRAKNRACADLFGFGEISAEEVSDDTPRYGGFATDSERRATIERLRNRIGRLGLADQVKALGHPWPWDADTCNTLDDFCDTAELGAEADPAPTDSAGNRQSEVEQSPGASGGSSEPPSPARVGDPSHDRTERRDGVMGPGEGSTPTAAGLPQTLAPLRPQAALDALAPPIALDEARALAAKRMRSEELQDSTPEQRQSIAIVGKELGWNDDQRRAFVWTVTKGRASGASKTNRGDAMRVAHALRLVAAHSLKVEWYEDHDDPQAKDFDAWVAQVTPANKEGRNWWIARP